MTIIAGPHAGQTYDYDEYQTLVVGRAKAAQVRLDQDAYFSRHHFCLEVGPPGCLFRDLGSRNGTFINGQRQVERRLVDGDVISGGQTQIRVSIGAPDASQIIEAPFRSTVIGSNRPSDAPSDSRSSIQPVPGYDVFQPLGKGGMGIVYRAIQQSTGKTVAIKIILPSQASSDESMRLFIREASLLGQLDHARIVRFHEFGLAAGQLFLAMEYVPTVELQTILRTQSQESRIRICCAIACQILEALAYAHSRSLVHRDIKPSNILVYQPQSKLRVKLADFGLAKNYVNAGFSGMTLEGDLRGTLQYIAPEQLIDSRHARPASDLYSLGATLYDLLSGTPPFAGTEGQDRMLAILEAPPPPLRARCPAVPERLSDVIERALAKDAHDRFSSAEEMRQALLPFASRKRPPGS